MTDPGLTGENEQCKLDELPQNSDRKVLGFGVRLILENSTVCQKSTRLISSTPSRPTRKSFGSSENSMESIPTIYLSANSLSESN